MKKLSRDLVFQLIMKLSMKIQPKSFQGLAEQDFFSLFQGERFKELYCKPKYNILHMSLLNFILLSPVNFPKVMR